jgi:aryl-phospho-beta-D-glucosidase BglC (GH1 family)
MTGMSSTSVQQAANIQLGWNIGNTLEAIGGETAWGNPLITNAYIQFVKQQGFNTIRLPCSWNQYSDPKTAKIQDAWLNRVKQVVQYCANNNMYVLLNIHWDGGWLENNCTLAKKDSVNAKQKAFWEQIATTMRDFDEHLMFASANEPNANDATQMAVLLSYHQTFVNAVRSTGGRNTYRILVVQGASALMNDFPNDPTPNRMMYEEHNYTPYQFTALSQDASWGKMFYYWGAGHHSTIEPDRNATWGEESDQNTYFQGIKQKFVDKGIPVIMGEYGAYRRTTPLDTAAHQASVDYWITFVTKQAIANGLKPIYWDTGGALDRQNNVVLDHRTINAIIAGSH